MDRTQILSRLASLELPPSHYLLHSSAALVLRGVLPDANDLDIVATGPAWEAALALVAAGSATVDRGTHDTRVSVGDDVEIYDGWLGEPAAAVVSRAELVTGVPCASLADIVSMKRRLDRPKDREHLALIARFMASAAE